jgi:glycosyltransferase involved in cell wall biosynthesis
MPVLTPGDEGAEFTIVIPTFNRSAHVEPCLRPFLKPEARGVRVVLVDDGSTDDTERVAKEAAARSQGAVIHYIRQANRGPSAARNHGVRLAEGRWVVFLDVDDRWFDWTLARVREALAQAGSAAMLFFRTRSFADDSELDGAEDGPLRMRVHDGFYAFDRDLPPWPNGTCNVAIRIDLYWAVGGLDESIRGHEDQELFYRLAGSGPVLSVEAPQLVGYRTSSIESLSANPDYMRGGMDLILQGMQAGRYPEPVEELAELVNARRLLWCRQYFARGMAGPAYRLIWPHRRYLIGAWGAHTYFRVLLTPVLALVKPGTYRFDWAAFLRSGTTA